MMRCHARYKEFRCQLEMQDHLPDRHIFTVEWDDDGNPLGEVKGEVQISEPITAAEVEQVVDGHTEKVTSGPGWHLSETGGIRFDEPKAERCSVCGHKWHDAECEQDQRVGSGLVVPCGCFTAVA